MNMNFNTKDITPDLLITDIVNDNYRTADVFSKYNVDFCCGGKMSLTAVCDVRGIDSYNLLEKLQHTDIAYQNAEDWPTDFLIDYLINIHHPYFKNNISIVQDYIDRFVLNHFKKYPGIRQLPIVTEQLGNKLIDLTKYESESLFPYIKKILHAYTNNEGYGRLFIKTLCKLSAEEIGHYHAQTEVLILQIENITNNFSLPENICLTHKVMLLKLREFIVYLKQHLFIEKKILIPATSRMEKNLLEEGK